MERLQGSPCVLGWNDSKGVLLSWDGTTPGESFSAGELTPGESFCTGMDHPRGVILSWDGTTPGESFCPRIERLQGSHSVLG